MCDYEDYSFVVENSYDKIYKLAYKKAKEIYGEKLPCLIDERLEKELLLIKKYNYAGYYLLAYKAVSYIRQSGEYVTNMTNLVKCGMLKDSDHNEYGNLDKFPSEYKNNCFENIFLKEVEALKPKVIFTLSSKVYNYLTADKRLNKIKGVKGCESLDIVALPHPARCRQGFTNEFYRTLWYCRTLEGMINAGIITDKEEQHKYWDKYVDAYNKWKEDKNENRI